jgi:hypothetical protein
MQLIPCRNQNPTTSRNHFASTTWRRRGMSEERPSCWDDPSSSKGVQWCSSDAERSEKAKYLVCSFCWVFQLLNSDSISRVLKGFTGGKTKEQGAAGTHLDISASNIMIQVTFGAPRSLGFQRSINDRFREREISSLPLFQALGFCWHYY